MLPLERNALRRLPLAVAAAVLATGMAGCGSDNDHHVTSPPPPSPPPVASGDQFIAYVQQVVATAPDTEEPGSTDAVTATMPDTSEPEPVN